MTKRTAIPVDTKREVLFASRHHCAVCCEPLPLEIAHIIPWRKSKDHSAKNLIALCPNCHTRADKEDWKASYLRRYKTRPCIEERATKSEPISAEKKAIVDLVIANEPDEMTPNQRRRFISMLAAYVGVVVSDIELIEIEQTNSSRIRLQLPKTAAEKIEVAVNSRDKRFVLFMDDMVPTTAYSIVSDHVESSSSELTTKKVKSDKIRKEKNRGSHARTRAKTSSTVALHELMAGNKRFRENAPLVYQTEHERTAFTSSQTPHTAVLCCADSRVSPEIMFNAALGELFVIRVAGNVADTSVIASLETAIQALGVKLIVVMGHEDCGTIAAAMKNAKTATDCGYNLNHLFANIIPALSNARRHKSFTKKLAAAAKAHARNTAASLRERSPVIANARGLTIVPGYYHLVTGKVDFL